MKSLSSHLIMEENHMDKLYKSKNPLVRFFHNQRLRSILKFIPEAKLKKSQKLKVLDAGCGEGHLLQAIYKKSPHLLIYGVDVTKIALASARKRLGKKAKLFLQDLTNLKFPEGYFDIVICADVLEHVHDYKKVIYNLKKVTKNGGRIIVSYPNETNLTISRFLLRIKPAKAIDHVNSFIPKKMQEEFNLPVVKQLNLPVNLLFIFSLEAVQAFKKQ